MSDLSFDNIAGPLDDYFDFSKPGKGKGRANMRRLFLDPMSGEVVK